MRTISLFLFLLGILLSTTYSQTMDVNVKGQKKNNVTYIERNGNSFYMMVRDDNQKVLRGIKKEDVTVVKNGNNVRVVSVELFDETIEITESIVIVLDNSSSMEEGIEDMLKMLRTFLNSLGKGIEIAVVMFDEKSERVERSGIKVNDELLNLISLDFTTDFEKVYNFCQLNLTHYGTQRTYLWDAAYYGFGLFDHVPDQIHKSIIFMTDGEDIGSSLSLEEALSEYNEEIYLYSVDVNRSNIDLRSAKEISEKTKGSWHRAVSAEDLNSLFNDIANELTGTYIVKYKWRLSDEFPLLGYIFFDYNSSNLDLRYHTFGNTKEALSFDESDFSSAMDAYHDILNIIGLRLRTNPNSKITVTGNNSDNGEEKGNLELSGKRAQTVSDYLTSVWGIGETRIKIEKRNLPLNPSSTKTELGLQENMRVEITSDDPNILSSIIANDYNSKVEDENTIVEKFSLNLFDFDSFEVKNIDDQVLNAIASIYSENSGAKIYVIGFSDNIGNEEYNRNLSVKRAKAVSVNLASKGVSNSDMTSEGYGPDNPQFSNDLPEGRFLNRTVRVYVKYPK